VAEVAIFSEINTKHINARWAEHKLLNFKPVAASRNQWALKD
jgi:hypothetical protein